MFSDDEKKIYTLVIEPECKRILIKVKSKKPSLYKDLQKQVLKIIRNPNLGKPLSNVLKNRRRIQVGSFVLLYEIRDNEVRLLDFDHHDRVYKKY